MNIPHNITTRISGHLVGICLAAFCLHLGLSAQAASTPPGPAAGPYHFDGTISRPVLENFLARSISVEGVFNGRGDLEEETNILKTELNKIHSYAELMNNNEKHAALT